MQTVYFATVQSGGNLRRPVNVHVEVFTDELSFYQLGSDVINQFRVDEGLVDAMAKPLPNNAFQRAVWTLLENPESSLAARIIAILLTLRNLENEARKQRR